MKLKLALVAILVILLLLALASVVMAQEGSSNGVPAPYAGLKNPLSWQDTSAQEAGKRLYQRSCLGCHGANGGSIASSDFSAASFPRSIEERTDYYFWIFSEGRLNKGMPPFKSSLSEEQRWQVMTYLWALGKAATTPGATPSPVPPPPVEAGGSLLLTAPQQSRSGERLTLTAVLKDSRGKPVAGATVKFFIRVSFFTTALMEIGEVAANDQGVAVLEYTPWLSGDAQIVARYQTMETTTGVSLTESDSSPYHTEVGIKLPAPGEEVVIGPASSQELGHLGEAPTSALRLPEGVLSWLLLLVATVMLVWVTYFRVIYQVFRISIVSGIRDTDTRLVPMVGMGLVVILGIVLLLMLITSPNSNLHVLR